MQTRARDGVLTEPGAYALKVLLVLLYKYAGM